MKKIYISLALLTSWSSSSAFAQIPPAGFAPNYSGANVPASIIPIWPGANISTFVPQPYRRTNLLLDPYFIQRNNIIRRNFIQRRQQLEQQRGIQIRQGRPGIDWRNPPVAENGDIRGVDNDGDGRIETIHVSGHIVRGHYASNGEKKYEEQPQPRFNEGPLVAENGDIRGEDNDGDGQDENWYVERHYRKGHYRAP